jgi:cytochrome c oxidase subunit 2
MKSIWKNLAPMLATATLWFASAGVNLAHAVNDLPGGPAVNQLNLYPPVTSVARDQQWLHWFMLILCAVIFVAVFAVMFYSIWKHRKSVGHKPATFHESVTVEIIWTVVPFIIVI